MVSKAEQQHVAATFVSQYYKLLMSDAQQVVPMYLPKATIAIDKSSSSSGLSEHDISGALRKLFPDRNNGRVVIKEARVESTEGSSRGFAIVVTGTYHKRHDSFSEDFKEIFELQEHKANHFGICAVHRIVENQKVEPKQWAMETPPMFAKAAPAEPVPPMPQEQPEPAAAAPSPSKPAPAAPVEPAVAVAAPSPAQPTSQTSSKPADDQPPKSMAERLRLASGNKPASVSAPLRVEAKSDVKEDAKASKEGKPAKTAAEEEPEKNKEERKSKSNKGEVAETGEGRRKKPQEGGDAAGSSKAPRPTSTEAPSGGEARPRRQRGGEGRTMSKSVVFFDVIVKGLNKDATEKTVHDLVGHFAPIDKVNIISQPDKHDQNVTRTFAFVLFDHSEVEDVPLLVQNVVAQCKNKFTKDRIQVDAVKEKFSAADTAAAAAAAAAAAPAPQAPVA